MQFLDFVKKRRAELGFSCRDFAAQVKMKPSDWNRIENGRSELDFSVLELLMTELAVSTDEQEDFLSSYLAHHVAPRPPLSEEQLAQKLPMVFRKADGTVMRKPELLRLAEKLKVVLA
jgi:transcriptional regulator with XRE-family HTH domain